MLIELIFYSLAGLLVGILFIPESVTTLSIIKALFPEFYGCWYVVYYLLFVLFVPFINAGLNKIDKYLYRNLLVIFLIAWSVIPTIWVDSWSFDALNFMLINYLIGGYIRASEADPNKDYQIQIKIKKARCFMITSFFLMCFSVIGFDLLGLVLKKDSLIRHANYFGEYYRILPVILSISAFYYFKSLTFFSKKINIIAKSTVGVYLIHEDLFFSQIIWGKISPNLDYWNASTGVFVLHSVIKCLAIFAFASAVDQFRIFVFEKLFDKYIDFAYVHSRELVKKANNHLIVWLNNVIEHESWQ